MSGDNPGQKHRESLLRLLDDLGRGLARQERLLEEIEDRHVRTRTFRIQAGAEEQPGLPDGNDLADELRMDLDLRLQQEDELGRILEVLGHRRSLQDRILEKISPRLASNHRDVLFRDVKDHFERRDFLFKDIEALQFEAKRDRIRALMPLMGELEGRLFGLVERHLVA